MTRHYRTKISGLGLCVALALGGLVGCPGPTFVVQQYAGPQRDAYTIAVLRVNGGDSVRLLSLDGEDMRAPIASDGRLHVELLPGRHVVAAYDEKEPNRRALPVAFGAEAGKVYRVVLAGESAHVYEVDRGSDATVRDVSADATARGD
ncbi:MAG: hypothetical protein JST00_25495 [Deltaproteobacteria bacterium]|nr:hypothetical protein [Deltaproteobacteria bacterium]